MRSVSVICIFIFYLVNAVAQEQIKQGVYSLGGSLSYSYMSQKDNMGATDGSTYFLAPSISYFIVDQCELSAIIEYQRTIETYSSSIAPYFSNDSKFTYISLGLGIRYYYPAGKIAPFIGVNGGTSWMLDQSQATYSAPHTYFRLAGGFEIFISSTTALEPIISYKYDRYDDQTSSSNIAVGVGVKYFIL